MQGFLQVKLLPRLRYILEMMAPPTPVVDMILRILTQVSRQSLQSANEVTPALATELYSHYQHTHTVTYVALQVFRCPRLLDTVFTVCLDSGEPRPGAVKLMVAIARAGRNLASQLVSAANTLSWLQFFPKDTAFEAGLTT